MPYYNENGSANVTFAPTSGFVGARAPDGSLYVTPQNLVTTGFWSVPTGGASGVAAAILTGTLTETAVATVILPVLSANSIIRVTVLWTLVNTTAGIKTMRIRLGGIAGTIHQAVGNAGTQAAYQGQSIIFNRGATNSQLSDVAASASSYSIHNGSVVTGAIDTSVAQTLVITGQLPDITDSMQLQGYLVEVLG